MPLTVAAYYPYKCTVNEINTVNTLRWAREGLRNRLQKPLLYAPTIPLAFHPDFPCLQTTGAIRRAHAMGLFTLGDLYPLDTFIKLPEAIGEVPASLLDKFLYHQLMTTSKALHLTFPKPPSTIKPLHNLLTSPLPCRLISRLYTSTQSDTPYPKPAAFLRWQTDLGDDLTDEHWDYCCGQLRYLSPNYKLRLIHFKYLHRFYHTAEFLHKLHSRDDSSCWKCKREAATFMHIAWYCPKVSVFWSEVHGIIREVTGHPLQPAPLVALLGYVEEVPPAHRRLTAMMLLLAKRRIAIYWGVPRKTRISEWLSDIAFCQEHLTHFWELMPTSSRPKDIWSPFLTWLKEREILATKST